MPKNMAASTKRLRVTAFGAAPSAAEAADAEQVAWLCYLLLMCCGLAA